MVKWIRALKLDSVFTSVASIATWQFLIRGSVELKYLLLSFFLSSAIYAGNSLGDYEEDTLNQPDILDVRLRHKRVVYAFCTLSCLGTVALAANLPGIQIALLLVLLFLGLAYSFPLLGMPRLKSFLTFKVVLIPLIWAGLTALFVTASANEWVTVPILAMMLFMASSMLTVSNWRDIEDLQGDQKAGVKTLATKFGTNGSGRISGAVTLISALTLLTGFAFKLVPTWSVPCALFLLLMAAVSTLDLPALVFVRLNRMSQAALGGGLAVVLIIQRLAQSK